MSFQTELLKLFGYEASDGESTFNIDLALNENWKKIDDYLKGVLLSDMSNADEATLQAAVKAIVLSMVVNNLTTTAADFLLDARQGKALHDALNVHLKDKKNPHDVTPEQLGHGYGTCTTDADTTAKEVTLANFVRRTGSRVMVYFKNAVPKSSTMNVGGTGAAYMRYKGSYAAGYISAGDYADFAFDGTYWQLLGISSAPTNYAIGSYTGTGTYGSTNKTTITTGFKPFFMVITSTKSFAFMIKNKQQGSVFVWKKDGTMALYSLWEVWNADGVNFYCSSSAGGQLNESGTVYEYIVIG